MNKPTKSQARAWSAALRSGEYEQGHHALQSYKKFCCLGVACKLFAPEYRKDINGTFFDNLPCVHGGAPKWLEKVNALVSEKIGCSLTNLNDDKRYSFYDIANIIDLVFVFGALEKKIKK